MGWHRAPERGSVTAEFAVTLPAVILLLALCLSAVQLGVQQLRVQDAAAVAARLSARGEGSAAGYIAELVPGSTVGVTASGELICATVQAAPTGGPFQAVRMSATSCAPGIDR